MLPNCKFPFVDEVTQPIEGVESEVNTLVALSRDLICIAGIDGYFKCINPAFLKLGYSEIELLSSPFIDFVHPDDRAATLKEIQRLSEGIPTAYFENRYRTKKGSYRWIAWTAVPRSHRIYAVGRDMTENKEVLARLIRTNEELAMKTSQLSRLNSNLEQFTHIASHDMQAPLRTIRIYTEMLAKGLTSLNDDQRSYLNMIIANTRNLQLLIKDLLTLSETEQNPPDSTSVATKTIVERVLLALESEVGETGATISVGQLPDAKIHEWDLFQVFQNLISNAIKYSKKSANPIIEIGVRLSEKPTFYVKDNGIGIKPEYHSKIFDNFTRLHSASEYPGTGLGLAICKRIIERYKGRIWVESSPNAGSTFLFTFDS